MSERLQKTAATGEAADEQSELDPSAVDAFDFLTGKIDYSDLSYDQLMEQGVSVDDMKVVEHKRRRNKSEHTLYMSDLLVGSKYSDNQFFNEVVEKIDSFPVADRPDQIVMTGLYMGDFQVRNKNRRMELQPGARDLNDQLRYGKEKLDQLRELGIPIVYAMSDNDIEIVEQMSLRAFSEMHELAKKHARENEESYTVKRQWSRVEKAKANPHWPEYYRFTKEVAFPYCVRSGRELRTAEEVEACAEELVEELTAKLADNDLFTPEIKHISSRLAKLQSDIASGEYHVPEREVLYDAYKREANGGRMTAKHRTVLDVNALRDPQGLEIVGDFERHVQTRGADRTDVVRHRFNTTTTPIANYFRTPKNLRGQLGSAGKDDYTDMYITGQHEAAGVFGPDNRSIHSIGGMQNIEKALKADGDALTSRTNMIGREALGRGRIHPPSATSVERMDDGRYFVTVYDKHLMEVSESIEEPTVITLVCDWQIGNRAARPDLQIKALDMMKRDLQESIVYAALGGDFVEGRNYSDYGREHSATGLGGMDQQFAFLNSMIRSYLEQLSVDEISNLFVEATIGNHEWNSGTVKWNGYSFFETVTTEFRTAFARAQFNNEEIDQRVNIQDTLISPRGEPISAYETVFRIGELGVSLSHFFGPGMGTGGQPPAFTAFKQQMGVGEVRKDIDVSIFGHYHHANYMAANGKLIVGAGSLNGITGFEYKRGLRSANSIVKLHVGGGKPPRIEVIGENAINKYKIKDGPFSDKELRGEGYRNSRGFDIGKHTPYMGSEFPKSALQKKILQMNKDASESKGRTGTLSKEMHDDREERRRGTGRK